MTNPFFARPILNSPYEPPQRHWELDDSGQPTQKIADGRRKASFVTPEAKRLLQHWRTHQFSGATLEDALNELLVPIIGPAHA